MPSKQTYGYAADNPTNLTHPSGQLFGLDNLVGGLIGGVAGGATSLVSQAIHGHVDWTDVGTSAASGAAAGATFTTCGWCAGAAASGVSDALQQLHLHDWDVSQLNYKELATTTAVGAGVGWLGDDVVKTTVVSRLLPGLGGTVPRGDLPRVE